MRTTVMRVALFAGLGIALSGCGESPAELARRKDRFATTCQIAEFSPKQCDWLWAYSESVRERQDSSDATAAGLAGVAIGSAAGIAASRR